MPIFLKINISGAVETVRIYCAQPFADGAYRQRTKTDWARALGIKLIDE